MYTLVFSCILSPLLTCNPCLSHLQTAPKIFGGNLKTHLLAFFSGEAGNYETIMTNLRDVATEFKGKVSKCPLLASSLLSLFPRPFYPSISFPLPL